MDLSEFSNQRYSVSLCPGDDPRVREIMRLIGKAGEVLDLGCIDGTIGAELIKLGNVVHGIDASERAVSVAITRGVQAKVGNLEKPLEFPDARFDAVVAGEVVEHILDVDLFVEEIHRVLKPRGILIMTTPNLATFGRRLLLLFNRNPHIEISFKGSAAGHVRYFVIGALRSFLKEHGFAIEAFTSDVINLNASGSINLVAAAKLFPTFGRSLIVRARKI